MDCLKEIPSKELLEAAKTTGYHILFVCLFFKMWGQERITKVPKLADLTYAHTLVIKSTHEYKVHGPFISTFDNQSISIGCVGKLGHLFGLLRHYLLRSSTPP